MVSLYLTFLTLSNALLWGRARGLRLTFFGPLPIGFTADIWSLRFYTLLGLISGSVVCWAYYYMDGEPTFRRFLALLLCFVGSIVLLVFISTLFGALVGWDGLGITSFLLVIYYKNRKSLGGGMITALTNRLGDAFLLVLLGLAFLPLTATYILLVLLLLTAITKSAQYPFRSWLPAAMAAPTPVRALVHSSTLVTAGVYLLLRFNHAGTEWLIVGGSITMVIAGLCACSEFDIKKIVALSTLSQLGVMMVGLGLALKSLRFFHLMTHACFKALLFLCIGVGIHTVYGRQEKRRFGSIWFRLPIPSTLLCVGMLSLMGYPFYAGFYSKDAILEGFYRASARGVALLAFLYGVGLTAGYSVKVIALLVSPGCNTRPGTLNGGGVPGRVKGPLLALGRAAILGGFLLAPLLGDGVRVLTDYDKLVPLYVMARWGLAGALAEESSAPLSGSLWGLTPYYQSLSETGVGIRSAGHVDAGVGEAVGGPGWLGVYLGRQLSFYPALSLALLASLLLLV